MYDYTSSRLRELNLWIRDAFLPLEYLYMVMLSVYTFTLAVSYHYNL